ncbi:MAG: RecX family transcriptional regulator, partial [Acidobacteria bacterium]|nr:RecX family transcriptional regulator [Acidobacteriota bacterium]
MPRSAPAGPPPSAYQRALRRLARRDHSEAELRRALAARGHSAAEIDDALSRLRAQRYVDDDAYAARFAR